MLREREITMRTFEPIFSYVDRITNPAGELIHQMPATLHSRQSIFMNDTLWRIERFALVTFGEANLEFCIQELIEPTKHLLDWQFRSTVFGYLEVNGKKYPLQ